MKRNIFLLVFSCLLSPVIINAQNAKVDSLKFFTDDAVLDMTLKTDLKSLAKEKEDKVFQPGTVSIKFLGEKEISQNVKISARGHFRRNYCKIPPMKIDFRTPNSPLQNLGRLKLVISCGRNSGNEELLFREYLCYKIYNLLEDKSFRVRLLNVTYEDESGKNKPLTQHAFLIEDDAEMARRNDCKKKKNDIAYFDESTNRELMNKVAMFEYFIANTDWSVRGHNIELIFKRKDDAALPFAVPYDFDFSGFVDAPYSATSPVIGDQPVTERIYRGYPRTMEELNKTIQLFKDKKEAIYQLINSFTLLDESVRKKLIDYSDEFYKTISDPDQVQKVFIDGARTD